MFRLAADVQVYLHREAIDFRIGINGLAILVEQAMHLDPFICVGEDYVAGQPNSAVLHAEDRKLCHIISARHRSRT